MSHFRDGLNVVKRCNVLYRLATCFRCIKTAVYIKKPRVCGEISTFNCKF